MTQSMPQPYRTYISLNDFEKATADQMAIEAGRSVPNLNDICRAIKFVEWHNQQRVAAGLPIIV
jgi:hypothetical protein